MKTVILLTALACNGVTVGNTCIETIPAKQFNEPVIGGLTLKGQRVEPAKVKLWDMNNWPLVGKHCRACEPSIGASRLPYNPNRLAR